MLGRRRTDVTDFVTQAKNAATATAEQVDAINAAAGPFGILSVILIIIVGAVLYFGVLPKVMTNDERKI